MPTEIKITDAERDLAALIQQLTQEGERIVLAAQDRPQAALISLAD
jgi:antitoxin (DNA-binding transcriptional repressor) of toxin-antitoxin stability system